VALRPPAAPAEVTRSSYPGLVDQMFGEVTITPNGRALLYTGAEEAGRPIMVWPLDRPTPRAVPGTEGGGNLGVAPDGRRLAFQALSGTVHIVSLDSGAATGRAAHAWRYGNGAWIGDSAVVTEDRLSSRGLVRRVPGAGTGVVLTRPDVARGESKHVAPLVLPGMRALVFTVDMHGGRGLVAGPLAIASIGPGTAPSPAAPAPHVRLGVTGRRAIALVDGWLLYTSADGLSIMAARLDVEHRRIVGRPVAVYQEEAGGLETGALADDGTLLILRRSRTNSLVRVDSTGVVHPALPGTRGSFMYPRFSPDGKHVAVQAITGDGGNDVWLYDLATQTPTRLTTTGGALHPTWTPDGRRIVFMVPPPTLMSQPVDGSAAATRIAGTAGGFGPSVTPDGRSVVFQRSSRVGIHIWSASTNGTGAPHDVVDDRLLHYMPALSPDGHWIADVSSETGQSNEVYVRPYPGPGQAVRISDGGGGEPAWSPDGHRVYYRTRGAFMAADITTPALAVTSRRRLFKDAFDGGMPHRNYDVAPDGSGFLMITGGSSEAVVLLHWLDELRARLAHAPSSLRLDPSGSSR
jgi:hypothetical protein